MRYFTFDLTQPVLFYKGGEFTSKSQWAHRKMYHRGDYELIFCIEGPLFLELGSEKIVLKKNDLLLVPPFTRLVGYKESSNDIDFYWLHFFSRFENNNFIANKEKNLTILKKTDFHRQRIILPACFHIENFSSVMLDFYKILSIQNGFSYIDERDYLTTALLVKLSKIYTEQKETSEIDNLISQVKEWIRANISADLTVEEIANQFNLNIDYITRLFKKGTGITPKQYITDLKINVAKLLLIRTKMPIKQIASESFFNNSKVFMRSFKKSSGVTPTNYRKSYNLVHLNNPHIDPQIPIPKRIEDDIEFVPNNGDFAKR